jgi:hypothetical protein
LECGRGAVEQAHASFVESLLLRKDQGNAANIAQSLLGLAAVALAEGSIDDGARLCGAIDASLVAAGAELDPNDQQLRESTERRLREAIGKDAFSIAQTAGREMPLDAFYAALERFD